METRQTRSGFLKLSGAAVLGAAGLPGVALGAPERWDHTLFAGAKTLKLANDKVTWKNWFNSTGKAAASAVGVGWDAVEYSDTTSYQAAIRTSGRTSRVPDLYTWWSGWLMKEIVDAGYAADVSSLWNKHAGAYSKGLRASFTFNGKTYGAPLYVGYWAVLYNKHIFKDNGLTPPKTWADLEKINETLKSNGVTPFGATIDGRWPGFIYFEEFLVRTNPGLYTRLMAGKAKYTDPGVVNAMKLWGTWIKKGYFTDPSALTLGTGASNFTSYFKQGKVGMVQIGTWFEPSLVGAGLKPGKDFGSFIMPMKNTKAPKVVIFESGPLVAAEHGANKADAIKALDFFMSRKGQTAWVKATGFVSPRSDVVSTSPVDRELTATIKRGGYTQLNRYWEATPHDIVEVAVDQFDKFMLKTGDPVPYLKTIQKQADKSWAKQKK
ncbi:MAG TPA: extracellular solute-binding protein [Gaiellaceae bacterium]|jgi:ABC-type glycerol-3-phosphate transport system substrate-binding protein